MSCYSRSTTLKVHSTFHPKKENPKTLRLPPKLNPSQTYFTRYTRSIVRSTSTTTFVKPEDKTLIKYSHRFCATWSNHPIVNLTTAATPTTPIWRPPRHGASIPVPNNHRIGKTNLTTQKPHDANRSKRWQQTTKASLPLSNKTIHWSQPFAKRFKT